MGGMAQGEVASKIAVETILNLPVDRQLSTPQERANWLIFATNTANQAVNAQVKEGGTTLSVILAVDRELNIAHIGDSRIYLLRNHQLCQLSEDHSYVAMLLASGQISYEESLCYPDRSVLTKSLGAKSSLSQGYIQDLSRYYENLSLKLENNDILILCSDGVWDLVSANELADIFETQVSLKEAVNQSIETVLQRGAHDNATILAFKCHIKAFQL
jgi:protein phosphatase